MVHPSKRSPKGKRTKATRSRSKSKSKSTPRRPTARRNQAQSGGSPADALRAMEEQIRNIEVRIAEAHQEVARTHVMAKEALRTGDNERARHFMRRKLMQAADLTNDQARLERLRQLLGRLVAAQRGGGGVFSSCIRMPTVDAPDPIEGPSPCTTDPAAIQRELDRLVKENRTLYAAFVEMTNLQPTHAANTDPSDEEIRQELEKLARELEHA